jgi:hypothetical protein
MRAATPAPRAVYKKRLEPAVAPAKAAHPERPVEVWAEDEVPPRAEADPPSGLGPDRPTTKGARPSPLSAAARHRLRAAADSGETVRYLATGLSQPFFAELLAAFARQTGAGRKRHIALVRDNAGWYGPEDRIVPDRISLAVLPPYTPNLQPAEHLWPLVDEAVANRHFTTLEALDAAAARCRQLEASTIQPHTDFHWWPRPTRPRRSAGVGTMGSRVRGEAWAGTMADRAHVPTVVSAPRDDTLRRSGGFSRPRHR